MAGVGLVTPRERLSNQELPPLKAGGNQALMVAGLTAAVATLHALFARDATGEGQLVDVSEVEPLASFQFLNVARWAYAGDPGDHGYGEGSRRVHCRDGDVSFLLFTGQDRPSALLCADDHGAQLELTKINTPFADRVLYE